MMTSQFWRLVDLPKIQRNIFYQIKKFQSLHSKVCDMANYNFLVDVTFKSKKVLKIRHGFKCYLTVACSQCKLLLGDGIEIIENVKLLTIQDNYFVFCRATNMWINFEKYSYGEK